MEKTNYTFTSGDFGFSDVDGNALEAVKIATLPGAGTLYIDANGDGNVDGGEALGANSTVTLADINAGRLSDAANMLNIVGRAYPRDARIYVSGWLLATKADNTPASLQAAERALALEPNSATAHYCKADSLRRSGDIVAARASLDTALMLMPNNLA